MKLHFCSSVVFALLWLVTLSSGQQEVLLLPRINGIDRLGSGYDIFYGNPLFTLPAISDPGFRSSIFDMSIHEIGEDDITSDGFYRIPRNVDVKSCLACSHQFTTAAVSSMDDYKNWLETKATWASSTTSSIQSPFSASSDFKAVKSTLTNDRSIIVESLANCQVYCATVDSYKPPKLSENFLKAVFGLPEHYNGASKDTFLQFIANFGTHAVISAKFGSYYGVRGSFCPNRLRRLKRFNIALARAAAEAVRQHFKIYEEDFINELPVNASEGILFRKYASKLSFRVVGAKPTAGTDMWALDSGRLGQPMEIGLVPIQDILDQSHFPFKLGNRKLALSYAVKQYCYDDLLPKKVVDSCSPPVGGDPFGMKNIKDEPPSPKYFVTSSLDGFTFSDAEAACNRYGTRLAVVANSSDHANVKFAFLSARPYCAWIGLQGGAGFWQWGDGTSYEFYFKNGWQQWEGNGGPSEKCVAMCRSPSPNGSPGWADLVCNSARMNQHLGPIAAICENIVKAPELEQVPNC